MANELIGQFDGLAVTALHSGQPAPVAVGVLDGSAFPAFIDSTCYAIRRVPNAAGLGTGLTANFLLIDDPLAPDPGMVVVLEVTYGPITAGTTTPDESAVTGLFVGTTADLATVTMPTPSGTFALGTIATAVAHAGGLAAGGWMVVRVKRKGTSGSDTHRGRIILGAFDVRNT